MTWNVQAIFNHGNMFISLYIVIDHGFTCAHHVKAYNWQWMAVIISDLLNRLLLKDLNIEFLRYQWLTFKVMRSMPTERFGWELKMFKGKTFWQTSGYNGIKKAAPFSSRFLFCISLRSFLFSWDVQGMDFTTDKLRSLVRKWHTLIEAHVDVKTTDNYTLRMFCVGFTRRRPNQVKRTCYAQSSQIRQVGILFCSNLW